MPIAGKSSVLLIGSNGVGKSTVASALEVLQKIARGTNRVDGLVKPKDLARGGGDGPMRFELVAEIAGRSFEYMIAFEFPAGFNELRVFEEKLSVEGRPVYFRDKALVNLAKADQDNAAKFGIDWHLVALPIILEQPANGPLSIFKQWLARVLILRPVPGLIAGESEQETLQPGVEVTDFGAWFTGLLTYSPASYATIDKYLKEVMPDLKDIRNPVVGKETRSLLVQFSNGQGSLSLPFADLSDGEKCFMVCALVLAANEAYGPLLCFWDEPDNYLALSEVGHFVLALRRAFESGGQFIATSHNPEAIRRFSDENTLVLSRNSHLEPTVVRQLDQTRVEGDLVSALVRGDV